MMTDQEILRVVEANICGEQIEEHFYVEGCQPGWNVFNGYWNFQAKFYRVKRKPREGYVFPSDFYSTEADARKVGLVGMIHVREVID